MLAMQEFDCSAGGFSSMLYWLEVQDMALQAAGGKPGPEAEAAAKQLIASLPHSVVLARSSKCADRLEGKQLPLIESDSHALIALAGLLVAANTMSVMQLCLHCCTTLSVTGLLCGALMPSPQSPCGAFCLLEMWSVAAHCAR